MSLNFNNGVANIRQTPGIISNISANKPGAADVATGTLYISTDTGTIERSDGATWVSLGGGSTADLQTVLGNGNISTIGMQLYINGTPPNAFALHDPGVSQWANYSNPDYIQILGYGTPTLNFTSNAFIRNDVAYQIEIQGLPGGDKTVLGFDSLTRQNSGGTQFTRLNYSKTTIQTSNNVGIIGLNIDFANRVYSVGDYFAQASSTFLGIDDLNQRLFCSLNLRSATAGGASGQHLKIRVGTTDYKIALLNP